MGFLSRLPLSRAKVVARQIGYPVAYRPRTSQPMAWVSHGARNRARKRDHGERY